jgi:hypothetical protein
MSRKVILYFILILLLSSSYLSASNSLRIINPRGFATMQGTIEEATVSVKPKGVYMEIGLYLTFSAKNWNYSGDSLEVEFKFDLPENSIVHDSWLWVGEDIIRGEIMDKWTASAIYEDIVKRRKDPSILYKRSANNYELRIFPILPSEKRKVKITYLVPVQLSLNKIIAPLPTELLRTSRYPVPALYLLTWLEDEWKNPGIAEFPDIKFNSLSDSLFGNYIRADITSAVLQSSIHFSMDSPLKNGIYLNTFKKEDEGFYQLAFLPSKALSISSPSKVALLFDFVPSTSSLTTKEILQSVKSFLNSNFSDKDSLNLIFSQLDIKRASEKWFSADSATIEGMFNSVGENPLSSYSNLTALLVNGIDFVKKNGNDGSIVLIASSDRLWEYQFANQLTADLINLMNPKIPIHVADFQDKNVTYSNIGGRYYRGNEYFYTNISRMTAASYFSILSGYSFSQLISETIGSVRGILNSFDLYTSLSNGYCYSRIDLSKQINTVYLDKPIIQIGKFRGELPFVIESSGVYESDVFSEKIDVSGENIFQCDSSASKIWTGNYIQSLETEKQSDAVINEIVDKSINERVLSIYSAFLCLEPSRGGKVCYDCMDESELTGIQESISTENDSLSLNAYPNPFNNEIQISVTLPQSEIKENISFKIYDILGQVVKRFEYNRSQIQNKYSFTWYGKNDNGLTVASGTYIFVVEAANKRYSKKLLYLK